jgi:TonB family protein
MNRSLLIVCFFLSIAKVSFAQKDTLVYYLKNSGKITVNKDSADFHLYILPPDPAVNKNLAVIKCYSSDGKINFVTGSKTHDLPLELEGPYISFFENGHRKSTKTYRSGKLTGDLTEYYPNGKLYYIKSYSAGDVSLKQCSDSSVNVICRHGDGTWKEYNEDFTKVIAAGNVKGFSKEGRWTEMSTTDTIYYDNAYKNGELIFSSNLYRYTPDGEALSNVDVSPGFPGGKAAFDKFVADNIQYPDLARKNGAHGRVMVAFVVEKDGYLDNLRVIIGIGNGCDEEAMRIIEKSPKWIPGTKDGQAVRCQYSTGVDFKIIAQ